MKENEIVKFIYEKNKNVNLDECFIISCEFNNLEMAKWIYEKSQK
jgi:hypothetical protein